MKTRPTPPNEPGRWTLLAQEDDRLLWRRDRTDPVPVTMFYLFSPPRQGQVLYSEADARSLFAELAPA